MGTEVWVLTRTMTDGNGVILRQDTLVFKDFGAAKAELCNIARAMQDDYDAERDTMEFSPRAASLYYKNGGTDFVTLNQITVL